MVVKSRKDISLKKLRKIVQEVYDQNGYKIIDWIEGACPRTVEKIREDAPPDFTVFDLALDAVVRAHGKEPQKNPDSTTRHYSKKFPGFSSRDIPAAKLTFRTRF